MENQPLFDLESAREALDWLRSKLAEMEELGEKGQAAMAEYDLDSAERYTERIHETMDEIQDNGIIIRDAGDDVLVDFPAIINDIPSYLCWKGDEDDIMFWHYSDEGFAGRRIITGHENILQRL